MTMPSDLAGDGLVAAPTTAGAAALTRTRPFYWSVRREIWENRSIYMGPVIASGVVMFGFLLSLRHLGQGSHFIRHLSPVAQNQAAAIPYAIMAAVVFFTSVIVAVFYCLGALQSERRDRSILFWKSLPVSDLTTVASKAIIPLLVLPVVTGVVILVAQAVMLLLSTVVYIASGDSALTLWMQLPLDRMTVTLLWGLLAVSLWYAPIYGWLLLVSGWARRAAFLWAFLTPLALAVVEKVAFDTDYVGHLIRYRIAGFMRVAFNSAETNITPDPVQFASTPGLWVGLAFAAVFLAAAVWQRRYREPI